MVEGNANVKAAAGLYYNLGKINFEGGKTSSSDITKGYFAKVGDVASGTVTGESLLKASEIAGNIKEIRVATKREIESIETTKEARALGKTIGSSSILATMSQVTQQLKRI